MQIILTLDHAVNQFEAEDMVTDFESNLWCRKAELVQSHCGKCPIGKKQDLREQLAALCHEQWSGWMRYMFSKCWTMTGLGLEFGIPSEFAEQWKNQMRSTYNELSEKEKDSDRKEADKILALLGGSI